MSIETWNGWAQPKVYAFIDENNNGKFDDGYYDEQQHEWVYGEHYLSKWFDFDTTQSNSFDKNLEIAELEITFDIQNQDKTHGLSGLEMEFEMYNPSYIYEQIPNILNLSTKQLPVLLSDDDSFGAKITIFGYKDSDRYFLVGDRISGEITDKKVTATITLPNVAPNWLPAEEQIGFDVIERSEYTQYDIPEQYWGKYGFIKDSFDKLLFIIPAGADTDGADITCYQCEVSPPRSDWHSGDHLWHLLQEAEIDDDYWINYGYQLVEWRDNLKDLVAYLGSKGLEVFGQELIWDD